MQASTAWAFKPLVDMSPAEFQEWQVLLEERTGIVLSPQRRSFLLAHLSARMRELGVSDYATYYDHVTKGPQGAVEWLSLLDRLTVKETRFFRHAPSFRCLDRYLRERVEAEAGIPRPWTLWSVGCASGEEAYSMAMQTAEVARGLGTTARFGVTGTDISLHALSRAKEGVYGRARVEGVEPALRQSYFDAREDGSFKVVSRLAERVCFARLNVLDLAKAPISGMDVIFCQNLLIYFHRWRRRQILDQLARRLAPGGLLVIGVGEVVGWKHEALQPVADDQVLAFRRKKQ